MRMRGAARRAVVEDSTEPLAVPAPAIGSGRHVPVKIASQGQQTVTAVIFLAAHVPLALLMDQYPGVATAHAIAILGLGVAMALITSNLEGIGVFVGYMVGADVLWRMTNAQVNWEFSKYAAAAIMIAALVRHRRLMPPPLPLLYFLLLLPSLGLTLANEDPAMARDQISFNLSGPFTLMLCAWFFSKMELTPAAVRRLLLSVTGPAIGVATLAAVGAFSTPDIFFSDSSNAAMSGGFGPNQVSGILGFAALLMLFIMLNSSAPRVMRIVAVPILVWLATQCALTFSRGGLYMAAGGAGVTVFFAARDARLRSRLIPLCAGILIIGNFFVVPYLDAFTQGGIGVRFQDTGVTGRDRLIQADIDLWLANPLLGAGPGEGRLQRGVYFASDGGSVLATASARLIAAHTEFSRMLAEHGVFGLLSIILFVATGFLNIKHAPDGWSRAVAAGLVCWSAMFMSTYAMRLLAPSFAFGMVFARFVTDDGRQFVARLQRRGGHLRPLTEGHPARKSRFLRRVRG